MVFVNGILELLFSGLQGRQSRAVGIIICGCQGGLGCDQLILALSHLDLHLRHHSVIGADGR